MGFDDSCYIYENLVNPNKEKGQEHCREKYDGYLAVINSEEEAETIGSYMNGLTVIIRFGVALFSCIFYNVRFLIFRKALWFQVKLLGSLVHL